MRFEGKFETFDCFLNAMHNDIETGKAIAHKYNYTLEWSFYSIFPIKYILK
jgi:hypothetical protein